MKKRSTKLTRGLASNIAAVSAFVLLAWVVAGLMGYGFALWSSLIGSIVLTALLNLGVNGYRALRA